MASSKEYLDFIMEQLSGLKDITYRAMMGEYIIYYRGKIVGGIYDDRFLVKPVETAKERMPNATYEPPYEGAKEMLLVDEIDNRKFLEKLLNAMYDELPAPKKMSKYAPLWNWIKENGTVSFKLTYSEIEKIAGVPIDHSFLTYKKELLDYGYKIGKISMKEQTVAFEKVVE